MEESDSSVGGDCDAAFLAEVRQHRERQFPKVAAEAAAVDAGQQRRLSDAEDTSLVADGKRNVLVVLHDGFDEMTAVTVIDSLRTAGVHCVAACVHAAARGGLPKLSVPGIAAKGRYGLTVEADVVFETTSNAAFVLFNGVVLPGGKNCELLCRHSKLVSLIKTLSYDQKFVCGVGEAVPTLLSRCCGTQQLPKTEAVSVDYNIITARSPADALDFSLAVVRCVFADDRRAAQVADALQYTRRDKAAAAAETDPAAGPS
eukprot:TRINITY_DN21379_c0_g1_i1.p1 TRINITY_DN21379_c0_g1~~TRINITY_DN21379_c0_g1_i1.p1  ORF type:complete len:282 (+),score=115.75 TRINITY_DN21379_c0_g1_i1:70-846(+)